MLISILFTIAFIAVGVLFMYKAVNGRVKSKKAQLWPVTKGKVLSSEVLEDWFRNSTGKATIAYVPTISYEYIVNGVKLTGSQVTFGSPVYDYIIASRICEKFAVDTEPDVYYNPAKPTESVLAPKSTEGMRSLIPGIFFIAAGILVGVIGVLFPN